MDCCSRGFLDEKIYLKNFNSMFGKVKRWLGIEGVKVELLIPDEIPESNGQIEGKIRFQSMHAQKVKSIRLTLTEKYTRGRFKNKLTDQYKIAEQELAAEIMVPAEEIVELDFTLPFSLVKSDMDEIGDKNFILKKVVDAAKKLKNVKSEYTLQVEAVVEGTALNPFDKKVIAIK